MNRLTCLLLLIVAASRAGAQAADPPPVGFVETALTPAASMKLGLGLLFDQTTVAFPEWVRDVPDWAGAQAG